MNEERTAYIIGALAGLFVSILIISFVQRPDRAIAWIVAVSMGLVLVGFLWYQNRRK